jgi:TolA-binding protein
MRRLLRLAVSMLLVMPAAVTLLGAPPRQLPLPKAIADALAEFPPYERTVAHLVRTGHERERSSRLIAEEPDTVQAVTALLARERLAEALAAARRIIEKRPDLVAPIMSAFSNDFMAFRGDSADEQRPAARELLEIARKQAATLPREQAAEAMYRLIAADNLVEQRYGASYGERLRPFATEYAGTEAAELAEVDLYAASVQAVAYAGRLESFETFARTRKSPCARAKALQRYASYQASGDQSGRSAGQDPTERFLRVFEVASQLESAEYARCDPKPNTVSMVTGLYAYKVEYAPGNIDRLIAAYTRFALAHFTAETGDPENGVGYLVISRIPDLYRAKGEPLAAIEQFLAQFEKQVSFPDGAAYLRAAFYIREAQQQRQQPKPGAPDPVMLENARQTLERLAAGGSDLYNRKALATLGWLHYFQGDFTKAREQYANYVSSYGHSSYAWVAALRAGQCLQEAGDWKKAADAYRAAVVRYSGEPAARVLGHAYAARALEATSNFDQATVEYRAAVAGWDTSYAPTYSMDAIRRPAATSIADIATYRNPFDVSGPDLGARLAQLNGTTAAPGGATVEQARWLVDHGRRKEATQVLADFARRYPGSSNIPEAQYLSHKARLYDALELLNIEGATNEAAGLQALDGLSGEPYDFPVFAAKVAKACVLWKQEKAQEAEKLLRDALKERVARQQLREPISPVEKDAAAIRKLLFLPTGGQVYAAQRGWNAFSWPAALPPFLLVDAEQRVKTADDRAADIPLYHPYPGLTNVVLVNGEELRFFGDLMNKVGGTKKREWRMDVEKALQTGVMETPNRPVGPSVNLMALLNKFFPTRPGHWGGWEFLTYPEISQIDFLDAQRTSALAHVTIGYSGCVLLLQNVDGQWKVVRVTSTWIT